MGGWICVGIKWGGGNEIAIERHTNDLFWRIQTLSFLEQRRDFQKFLDAARPNAARHDLPLFAPRVIPDLHPSEYGIVLLDFDAKAIFSFNGYDHFNRLFLSREAGSGPYEELYIILIEHFSAGSLRGLKTPMLGREIPVKPDDFFRAHNLNRAPEVYLDLDLSRWFGEVLEHMGPPESRGNPTLPEEHERVRAWLKSHGWKTPYEEVLAADENDDPRPE